MMAPPDALSDDELLSVADDPALKAKLTPEEMGRLSQLRSQQKPRSWTDTAVDALPSVGGALGGVVGGIGGTVLGVGVGGIPGAIGGATLGGGAGEAAKQLINRARGAEAPTSATDAALGIGKEGAIQGALEGVGAGLMKGASGIAHGLMDTAVRPTASVADQFGGREAVINTVMSNRLPVGRVLAGQTGRQQAAALLTNKSRQLRALLDRAGASGTTFGPNDVQQPIMDLIDSVSKEPLAAGQLERLDGMISEFLKSHPGPLKPNDLKDLTQAAQQIASPIYRAQAKGELVPAAESLRGRFNQAVATGGRQALQKVDPAVAGLEGEKQALIGATKALRSAENRRMPLSGEAAAVAAPIVSALLDKKSDLPDEVRHAATAYLVARGLMSPRAMSRGALALTSRQVQGLLREVPRLGEAVMAEISKE